MLLWGFRRSHGDSAVLFNLNLLNFLNGVIHLLFMELFIIIFRDSKMRKLLCPCLSLWNLWPGWGGHLFPMDTFLVLCKLYPTELLTWTCPPFISGLSIINFGDIKMTIWSWSGNSIEPIQTAWKCRLTWVYTGGKG